MLHCARLQRSPREPARQGGANLEKRMWVIGDDDPLSKNSLHVSPSADPRPLSHQHEPALLPLQ